MPNEKLEMFPKHLEIRPCESCNSTIYIRDPKTERTFELIATILGGYAVYEETETEAGDWCFSDTATLQEASMYEILEKIQNDEI